MKESKYWTGEAGMRSKNTHVVFPEWQITFKNLSSEPPRVAVVGVWIDLDELVELAVKAATNKGRKARDGALNVELHTVREVPRG
jgi:hypothetical protein